MVMLAIMKGTMIPKNATNFLKPVFCRKAFVQVKKTNALTKSCSIADVIFNSLKMFVKFASIKNVKPVTPETIIHFESVFIMCTSGTVFETNYR